MTDVQKNELNSKNVLRKPSISHKISLISVFMFRLMTDIRKYMKL